LRRLTSILLWAVIAAAFIGPGTVTACAAAGARHGYALLWALTFSTFGCFVLQEAAARITIVSGRSLAEALSHRDDSGDGGTRVLSLLLVAGAIVVGCAAYEAGNILGAVAGVKLGTTLPGSAVTIAIGGLALLALWVGDAGTVARAMGVVVAVMGLAFATAAIGMRPSMAQVLGGAITPSIPDGAGLLVIGLVGTTIVPYNLFLGSGLARGERLDDTRLGLAVAVGIGGLISMAVVIVGTALPNEFSFAGLHDALQARLGIWAGALLVIGLFCAGFSSAVTAPLAAAITARGLLSRGGKGWGDRDWRYRSVWLGVLAVGVAFGLSGVRPIPVILLAQALNGLLLPVVAGYLVLVANDRRLLGEQINGWPGNLALAVTFLIATVLGTSNLLRAGAGALGQEAPAGSLLLLASLLIACSAGAPLALAALRRRGTVGA